MTTLGFQSQTLSVSGITAEVETLANTLNFSPKVDESRLQSLINHKPIENIWELTPRSNKHTNNCLK